MMREILFRGKTRRYGEWVYGDLLHDGYDYTNAIWEKESKLVTEIDPDTAGQYTGLKDKNGKRIFEGDILKCEHTVRFANENEDYSKIRYSYGGVLVETTPGELVEYFGRSYEYRYLRNYVVEYYRGNLRLHNKSCTNNLVWSYIINHNIEVIGNIHDNPELIGG